MPIKGGCLTQIADAVAAHDVTFSNLSGVLLTITPDGRLVPGPALSHDRATRDLAAELVTLWGRCYGADLRKADERAKRAEAEAAKQQRDMSEWRKRARTAEAEIEQAKEKAKAEAKAKAEEKAAKA